jgi:hypothetical protein
LSVLVWLINHDYGFFYVHEMFPYSQYVSDILRKMLLPKACRNLKGRFRECEVLKTLAHFVADVLMSYLAENLKWQCHEIFCFWFFFKNQFPPSPEYPNRTVSNFFENSRRYSQVKVHHRYGTVFAICSVLLHYNVRTVSFIVGSKYSIFCFVSDVYIWMEFYSIFDDRFLVHAETSGTTKIL